MQTKVLASTALLVAFAACSSAPRSDEGPEPEGPIAEARAGLTVGEAVSDPNCLTAIVKGLSEQIIAQGNCLAPGAFAAVEPRPNLVLGPAVFPNLEQPAADALAQALDAKPGMTLTVNSMLRTVAQQYLLYAWWQQGLCGITLAATPGDSPHETGLALDIDDHAAWQPALEAAGFQWHGPGDVVHFDYVGPGAVNYKGTDVLAFQTLWNLNHPGDLIDEDGVYGPQTESKLILAPATGFAKGPDCGGTSGAGGSGGAGGASTTTTSAGSGGAGGMTSGAGGAGGAGGVGGAVTGTGGAGASGSSKAAGCSCALGGEREGGAWAGLAIVGLGLSIRGRRRRV
jgi:MYXO-CTERM domain-containing protein